MRANQAGLQTSTVGERRPLRDRSADDQAAHARSPQPRVRDERSASEPDRNPAPPPQAEHPFRVHKFDVTLPDDVLAELRAMHDARGPHPAQLLRAALHPEWLLRED